MRIRVRWALLLCVLGVSAVKAQTPPPVIFFTDLTFAPNSGGETVSGYPGAYVTIYGNFFGTSQGNSTVTWNGSSCLRIVNWGTSWLWYQKIVIQLGSQCTAGTGNFIVNVNGHTSNGASFSVGPGHIYFISASGSDSNSGSFSSPWRTIPHAIQTAGTSAGNIIYAMNGVQQTSDDGEGWDATLTMRTAWCQGTSGQPNALVAYPGVTNVQIGHGTAQTPGHGLRSTDTDAWTTADDGYWTFAGINFRGVMPISVGGGSLTRVSQGWRFIGNNISNPQSTGSGGGGAAMEFMLANNSKVLGNYLHDLNQATTDRLWQGLYLSTDANLIEIGWNELYNSKGRAGIQTHSSNLCYPSCSGDQTGFIQHDLTIHDNKIHHTSEEALLVDTVDPSVGSGVKVYNNVIYDCGVDGQGDCAHFQLSGDFNQSHGLGASPAPVWWFNNTVYATNGEATFGNWWPDVHSGGQTVTSRAANNVFYSANARTPYLHFENYSGSVCGNGDSFSACGTNSGTQNIMFGVGVPTSPSLFTNSLNQDPLFVTVPSFDFHLQSGSPALGAGLHTITDHNGSHSVTAPVYDIDGRIRPNPPSIGAYEVGSSTIVQIDPPSSLTATVQ